MLFRSSNNQSYGYGSTQNNQQSAGYENTKSNQQNTGYGTTQNNQQSTGSVSYTHLALLPYAGISFFSEMGIGYIDIEQCLTELPTWQTMTTQNRIAFFWWIAAVLFTLVLLWKVTGHSVFISMAFLGGIASEAVLHFSPTIYASGARVYYLTDLMYLFIILWMVMRMDKMCIRDRCGSARWYYTG